MPGMLKSCSNLQAKPKIGEIASRKLIVSSLMLVFGILFLTPALAPVHGQFTGTVCIIPTSSNSCPSSPAIVSGSVGTQLRVSIFMQSSDGINGFQIMLQADHTILKPAGADLTGTVLIAPQTVLAECLGGVLVRGPACSSVDTVDTLEFAANGALGQLTATPTTGLLFTAIYNVTASTAGTPIGYQMGCSNSSVSGTTTCVLIANGGGPPVPETVQTATFTTNTSPSFTLTANPSSLSIVQGNCGSSQISVNSVNGFSGTVALTSNVSPTGPSSTLSQTSVSLSAGGSASTTLTVCSTSSTPVGNYLDVVTGTNGPLSASIGVSVTITSTPPPPDFAITVTPASQTLHTGSTVNFIVTVSGINGFSSPVSLTATVSPIAKHTPTTQLNPTTIGPGQTSTLTAFGLHNTSLGTYTITVTGTSGSLTHLVTVTVTVTH